MTTSIYFVRHGKVYNPTDIWYGRLPSYGLQKEGQEQIKQTAKFLAKEHIDVLYTSPLLRAKQTADIINQKLKLPKIHFSKDLLEINSSLQGSSFTYLHSLNYDVFAAPSRDITGETIEEAFARIEKFMHIIIKKYPGKKIVAVSHGDPLMIAKAIIEHLPKENVSIRPGSEKYVQLGEVYKINCDENIPLTLTSVFKPNND